jgi:hypothetical protein
MTRLVSRTTSLQGEAILHNSTNRMKVEESFSTDDAYLSVRDMNMEMRTKFRTPSRLISNEGRLGKTKSREEEKKGRKKHYGMEQKELPPPNAAHWHSSSGNSMQWITEATELKDSRSESSTVSQERTAAAIKSSLRDAPQLDTQPRKTRVPRRYRDGRGGSTSQHCIRDTPVPQPPKAYELTHATSTTQRSKPKVQKIHPNQKVADDKVKVNKKSKKKSERRMRPLPVILEHDDALTVQPETTTNITKVDKYTGLSFTNCVEQSFKQTYDLIVGSYDSDSSSGDEYSYY